MAKRSGSLARLYILFGFIILFVFAIFFITQPYLNKRLSNDWKTYTNDRLAFKVKVPQDTQTRIISAGFDNGMGFGKYGISRIEFYNKSFLIKVDPSKNARDDKTIRSLAEVREYNGLPNVAMGVCCSQENEVELHNGKTILFENQFLQEGEKYGISATILGKEYFYNISSGNIYNPNFTHDQEMIFMEFLNTFQAID